MAGTMGRIMEGKAEARASLIQILDAKWPCVWGEA